MYFLPLMVIIMSTIVRESNQLSKFAPYDLNFRHSIKSSQFGNTPVLKFYSPPLSPVKTKPVKNPELVYKSYQNQIYCKAPSKIRYPKNGKELQKIIRKAIKKNLSVKLIGGKYSITDIICTDGIPISTKFINYIKVNSDGTATFGSGVELETALETLHKSGLTLEHVPTFGGITIGGAIGTGAHGSSLLHPSSLSDMIVNVVLIDGNGDFRLVTEDDGEDFKAIGVHLGVLGAIVNVTLKTVPLFKMRVRNYPKSEDILLNGKALKDAYRHDLYQLWWFPNLKSVVVSNGTYKNDLTIKGNASTNLIPDVDPNQITVFHNTLELIQAGKALEKEYLMEAFTAESLHKPVMGKPPIFSESDKMGNKRFVNPAIGYGHRLLANKCNDKCAWDNGNYSILPEEFAMAFDLDELPKVVRTIKRILKRLPAAFPLIGIFIRFSKSSNNLLAIESGRDTVHFDWTTVMRTSPYEDARNGIGAYQAILQAMIKDHDGRPHWGKNGLFYFTQSILKSQHPNLKRFQKIMKKFDPNGLFLNKFGRRLLLQDDELDIDPNVKHCALQDYCLCRKDSNCANFQRCRKFKDKFKICEDRYSHSLSVHRENKFKSYK